MPALVYQYIYFERDNKPCNISSGKERLLLSKNMGAKLTAQTFKQPYRPAK